MLSCFLIAVLYLNRDYYLTTKLAKSLFRIFLSKELFIVTKCPKCDQKRQICKIKSNLANTLMSPLYQKDISFLQSSRDHEQYLNVEVD